MTPNIYFAIELENHYSWKATLHGSSISLETEPGDIWINPPFTPFTHTINEPCNFIIITIDEDTLHSHFDGYLPSEDLIFLNNYNIQDKTIEYILQMLLLETINKGRNGEIYLNNLLKLFSNYFIRQYSNFDDIIQNTKKTSVISENDIKIINDFIRNRINETITIEDLANTLNISKFHFLNEFKKLKGITPYQYIISMKIDEVKKLLRTTNDQITTIALNLGFSDSSHFIRTFKRITNQTALQYKKDIKNNNLI